MQRRTFYLREIEVTHGDMVCLALCFSNNTLPLLHLPAAFIKERKMGLNDFIQKLVSTPHICQQWVYLPFENGDLKRSTIRISGHIQAAGFFFFCFALFWGFCYLIASPFMIYVHHQSVTWTWLDVLWASWGVIWVPGSQVKNSPFMTSPFRGPRRCLITFPANPICPLDGDKLVIQLLHDAWSTASQCPDIQVRDLGCAGRGE